MKRRALSLERLLEAVLIQMTPEQHRQCRNRLPNEEGERKKDPDRT